jgi:hypothetical protein
MIAMTTNRTIYVKPSEDCFILMKGSLVDLRTRQYYIFDPGLSGQATFRSLGQFSF